VRIECFGQTRVQDGRQHTQNQDAFSIGHGPVPWAALCDGAGNAQAVARRALGLLENWFRETTLAQLMRSQTWERCAKTLDSALLGGAESTLVAVAVIGDAMRGVVVGDSRAYCVPLEGATRQLAPDAHKARLGSGAVEPAYFEQRLQPRDTVALLSDGAWGPIGPGGIDRVVRANLMSPLVDLPNALLDEASRRGRADDMTVVILRAVR